VRGCPFSGRAPSQSWRDCLIGSGAREAAANSGHASFGLRGDKRELQVETSTSRGIHAALGARMASGRPSGDGLALLHTQPCLPAS